MGHFKTIDTDNEETQRLKFLNVALAGTEVEDLSVEHFVLSTDDLSTPCVGCSDNCKYCIHGT